PPPETVALPLHGALPISYRAYDFATRQSGAAFDCAAGPVNASPNNTGARQLPPARPAWLWYPYADTDRFPELNPTDRNNTGRTRSEEHTSELQSRENLVC